MKNVFSIVFVFLFFMANAQEPLTREQQLENEAVNQELVDDDSYQMDAEQASRHRLNVNDCTKDDLQLLHILTDLQIDNLLHYRQLLGNFLSLYELQAVPSIDIVTIKKLLPFIRIDGSSTSLFKKNFFAGDHSIVLRTSRNLEKSVGYTTTNTNRYQGDPNRLFFRYGFTNGKDIQYGLTAEKDAGESFFGKGQKYGFDFYSFHFFARKAGIFDAIAIGDFTVNMGQGLIQWQSLAFKKSVDVMAIKRQSPVLRPYRSVGETLFQRGVGLTAGRGKLKATGFVSYKPLSGNFIADSTQQSISSVITSGYYRTPGELADRYNIHQVGWGGVLKYATPYFHLALNGVGYQFNVPIQKDDKPYNVYAISGNNWTNYSTDFSYTYKNIHTFGEAAIDKKGATAFIGGILASVDRHVDLSLNIRAIDKKYQSLYGNAFTENVLPSNEKGAYLGLAIKPLAQWRLDMYGDVFSFPWLRYRVNSPSNGKEFLTQLTYKPSKTAETYIRYVFSSKQLNGDGNIYDIVENYTRQNFRLQSQKMIYTGWLLRGRVELINYAFNKANEKGVLCFFDAQYKPLQLPIDITGRLLYFNTDGYNSRIYTYENDVLYSYSIPFYYGKGLRSYVMVRYDVNKKIALWLRSGLLVKQDNEPIGSGLEQIAGKHRSDVKLQLRYNFN